MSTGSEETQAKQKREFEDILNEIKEDDKTLLIEFATWIALKKDVLILANIEYQVNEFLNK